MDRDSPFEHRVPAEGGNFIRNAALARDGGASREFFVGRREDDLRAPRRAPGAKRTLASLH
jgi:hypothetical protein